VIDYSFHGVIQHVNDAILDEMAAMVEDEGISSFKFYLTYGHKLNDTDALRVLTRLGRSAHWRRYIRKMMPPSLPGARSCWLRATARPSTMRAADRSSARPRPSPE
jgi:hypothetical protein